jgi:hypothetical protein
MDMRLNEDGRLAVTLGFLLPVGQSRQTYPQLTPFSIAIKLFDVTE